MSGTSVSETSRKSLPDPAGCGTRAKLPSSADIVIIGAGIIGASIAYHLARLGCRDVVILDKEPQPGLGSTSKACGGIRAQFSTEINVRLSLLSMDILEAMDQAMKSRIQYIKPGYLFMTAREKNLRRLTQLGRLQNSLGAEVELLSADEIRRKAPYIDHRGLRGGSFGSRDGFVRALGMVEAFLSRALERGARLFLGAKVTELAISGCGIKSVVTPVGTIRCDRVINAAGPYAAEVARLAGVEIPVLPVRRHIAVTRPVDFLPPVIPMTIDYDTGLLIRREQQAVALACADVREKPGFDTAVDEAFFRFIRPKISARYPLLKPVGIDPERSWAGLYEVTPDNHPILGSCEGLPGFYLANGFSGHGIMHAPAVGQLMSELVLHGTTDGLDIGPLGLNRFRTGKLIHEHAVL